MSLRNFGLKPMKMPKFSNIVLRSGMIRTSYAMNFIHDNKFFFFTSKFKQLLSKLKLRWMGPYKIKQVYPCSAIEHQAKDGNLFHVNG